MQISVWSGVKPGERIIGNVGPFDANESLEAVEREVRGLVLRANSSNVGRMVRLELNKAFKPLVTEPTDTYDFAPIVEQHPRLNIPITGHVEAVDTPPTFPALDQTVWNNNVGRMVRHELNKAFKPLVTEPTDTYDLIGSTDSAARQEIARTDVPTAMAGTEAAVPRTRPDVPRGRTTTQPRDELPERQLGPSGGGGAGGNDSIADGPGSGEGFSRPSLSDFLDSTVGVDPSGSLRDAGPATQEVIAHFAHEDVAQQFLTDLVWRLALRIEGRDLRSIIVSHGYGSRHSLLRFDPDVQQNQVIVERLTDLISADIGSLTRGPAAMTTIGEAIEDAGLDVAPSVMAESIRELVETWTFDSVRTELPTRRAVSGPGAQALLATDRTGLALRLKHRPTVVLGTIGILWQSGSGLHGITAAHVKVSAAELAEPANLVPRLEWVSEDQIMDAAEVRLLSPAPDEQAICESVIGPHDIPAVGIGLNIKALFFGGRSGFRETEVNGADVSARQPRRDKLTVIYTPLILAKGDSGSALLDSARRLWGIGLYTGELRERASWSEWAYAYQVTERFSVEGPLRVPIASRKSVTS